VARLSSADDPEPHGPAVGASDLQVCRFHDDATIRDLPPANHRQSAVTANLFLVDQMNYDVTSECMPETGNGTKRCKNCCCLSLRIACPSAKNYPILHNRVERAILTFRGWYHIQMGVQK
jgi:hypothetical protein